jgi:glycosyltransferase involved in cell wall biosynthesis
MRKKVLVRGPCLTQSGYGEHARMVLRALHSREDLFDIFIIPVGWGQTGWLTEVDEFRTWMDQQILKTQSYIQQKLLFDISIQVSIPNEWEDLAPINIGVTAGIETTKVAPVWLQKANEMDKVIVVSEHAKWGFENTIYDGQDQDGIPAQLRLQTPIEVVGYPVRCIEPDINFDLDLDYDFNYLTVGQWGPRKNIENLVRWWLEECWDQEVGLVVKTSHRRNNKMDRQYTVNRLKYIANSLELDEDEKKCKVYLLHGDLSESEMAALYNHPKISCMVTTAHGEGFGLPLFEFAQAGKPIVAPDWSGHLSFLVKDKTPCFLPVNYDIRPVQQEAVWNGVIQADSMWCFPHEGSFKQRIRQVRKGGKWLKKAKVLQEWVLEEFTLENQHRLFVDSIYAETIDVNGQLEEFNSSVVEFG